MPVPASMMILFEPQVISKQVVLPPYLTVSGPGHGMLPRVPQNLSLNRVESDIIGSIASIYYKKSELGNLQSILLGLGGEGANADAMRVIRNQLLESINSGNVVGILENMIRYHAQLTDMFSDMVDLLDTVDLPADIREEITRNLETFYQNFSFIVRKFHKF